MDIIELAVETRGVKRSFSELISEGTMDSFVESMRTPDWTLLLFKLKSMLSDEGYQSLLNITCHGRTGVCIAKANTSSNFIHFEKLTIIPELL